MHKDIIKKTGLFRNAIDTNTMQNVASICTQYKGLLAITQENKPSDKLAEHVHSQYVELLEEKNQECTLFSKYIAMRQGSWDQSGIFARKVFTPDQEKTIMNGMEQFVDQGEKMLPPLHKGTQSLVAGIRASQRN